MAEQQMRRGVVDTGSKSAPDVDDFDMHTTLVPAQVTFEHQRRWNRLSAEDIRNLHSSPLTSLPQVFSTFAPEADFSVDAERRDELISRLQEAGVSASKDPGALTDWAVKGQIREMNDFSPAGVARGGEHWEANVLADLGDLDQLMARASGAAADIDFDSRDKLAADIDAILEILGTASGKK